MSEQVFIILINCIVRGLNRNGKQITGYVTKHWLTVGLRHTHTDTFRRASAQYRFMYDQPGRRR
ncbi:hypothetical protein PPTG_10978 [Phytophthora nicotianae INRA-310]|uniref:Uncharacterized protein n=1 Tax=Phytophthora nicotianae (strain INRA-310) TaxID=761204 RepID=W2QBV6_PHYN3|nr:hypothetical protein PPTG_10978 [Phytophthora nicotianae INRA-310]ETN10326.1 hypothetical protein PPTG_10978 [Phytophthora nicotianae INRA-310]